MTNSGSTERLAGWFAGRVPDEWFTEPPTVQVDREEILVTGRLAEPDTHGLDDAARQTARQARIEGFREDTRAARMRIADDAESRFGRKVAWAADCGDQRALFTGLSVPVMTRL